MNAWQDIPKSKYTTYFVLLKSAQSSNTVFSGGIDLMELYKPIPEKAKVFWSSMQEVWLKLYGSSFPTAAAINVSKSMPQNWLSKFENLIDFYWIVGSLASRWMSFSFVLWVSCNVTEFRNRFEWNAIGNFAAILVSGINEKCFANATCRKCTDTRNNVQHRRSTQNRVDRWNCNR